METADKEQIRSKLGHSWGERDRERVGEREERDRVYQSRVRERERERGRSLQVMCRGM